MDKIFELIGLISTEVLDSSLSDLDKNDTLLNLNDLKQEIYERFTITSKPQNDE